MVKGGSLTRRVIAALLGLEAVAALALIAAAAINERHSENEAFNANLRASSNYLLGAVQEGFDENVRLDLSGRTLPRGSIFLVTDETGKVLGSYGAVPHLAHQPDRFEQGDVNGQSFRFYTLVGEKLLDPFRPGGGIRHYVTIVYGLPDGHIWHEVLESIRFFAVCTVILLGLTALLMVWIVRQLLSPINALADSAGQISTEHWMFDPPASASRFEELRPLKIAIERAIERLQSSFQQQKRFTSDAAHELKTDLAIVKSSLQLLAMRERSIAEYKRGFETALDDLTRLERTVGKMLTLGRLEQNRAKAHGSCRLDEAMQLAAQHTSAMADLQSVALRLPPLPHAVVPVSLDDAVLLCSNVILNALQHSPQDGAVEVSMQLQSEQVCLTVCDEGEGIAEQDPQLLFEPFYRSDPSRSRRSGGTGLGLSICKAICERAGGGISIRNRSGAGAVVEMVLPLVTKIPPSPSGLG